MSEARLVVHERPGRGERDTLAEVYDRYGDLVFDFCHFGQTDEVAAAATIVAFRLSACRWLGGLDDPVRLKPWLLGQAQRVLRPWRDGQHPARIDELPKLELGEAAAGPQARRVLELAAWGLERDDRQLLALYRLEVGRRISRVELARARGFGRDCSDARLVRLRERLDAAIVAVVVAQRGLAACAELGEILALWQGCVSPALCRRVLRHARRCGRCGRCRAQVEPGEILTLAAIPSVAAPAALRGRVLTAGSLQPAVAASAASPSARPQPAGHGGRQQLVRVAAAVALAAAASMVVWVPGRARPVPFTASSGSGSSSASSAPSHPPVAGPSGVQVPGPDTPSAAASSPRQVGVASGLSLAVPSAPRVARGSSPSSTPSSPVGAPAPSHGLGRRAAGRGGHHSNPARPGPWQRQGQWHWPWQEQPEATRPQLIR